VYDFSFDEYNLAFFGLAQLFWLLYPKFGQFFPNLQVTLLSIYFSLDIKVFYYYKMSLCQTLVCMDKRLVNTILVIFLQISKLLEKRLTQKLPRLSNHFD
jgi:hypothetical protein